MTLTALQVASMRDMGTLLSLAKPFKSSSKTLLLVLKATLLEKLINESTSAKQVRTHAALIVLI